MIKHISLVLGFCALMASTPLAAGAANAKVGNDKALDAVIVLKDKLRADIAAGASRNVIAADKAKIEALKSSLKRGK
ncbi:MAG: hypothetical protein HQL28_06500 [Candidatus Omnitrophica bacterium]|nr:hypothetical protein [Candidatus Omnitrophota bacterium]